MKEIKKNNDPEALRFEIELKKARLNLKTGMKFESNMNDGLPPEIENAFLDSVERFEEAWQHSKKITVFDKLQRPQFRKSEELGEREVTEALKHLHELMKKFDIYVDTICPVDDRLLYEFITEELMEHEMDDLNIPDMMIGFTYEEFHPNHEHDITGLVSKFVRDLLNHSDFEYSVDHKTVTNFQELKMFCSAFERITVHHFNISQVTVTDEKATASFQIKFTGYIDRSSGNVLFTGPGTAALEYKNDYWRIQRLELPI